MADPAGLLVEAALDALGVSSGAREQERRLHEAYYSRGSKGLEQGYSLKEMGVDPKVVEQQLGPEYAATLIGAEKTDAFKMAAQSRQTRDFLKSAFEGFVSSPETQTVEGVTPEEAQGFYPRLQGPGIGGAEEVATASLTRPGAETIEGRLQQLPGLTSAFYGPEVAAQQTSRKRLEQVDIPGVGQEGERIGIAGRQAAVGERGASVAEAGVPLEQERNRIARGQLQLEKSKEMRRRKEFGIGAVGDAQRTLAYTHPMLTTAQSRKVGRYYAGQIDEKSLGKLADIPGVVKSAAGGAGGLKTSQAYQRMNKLFDETKKFVTERQGSKQASQYDDAALAGLDDADLRNVVPAVRDYLLTATGAADPASIAGIISEQMSFRKKKGSKLVAVPFAELSPDEQQAKLRLIEQALSAGGGGGGSAAVDSYLQRATGKAAPTQAAAAPAAQPTPGATQAGPTSIIPGGGSVPGVNYPVAPQGGGGMGLPAGLGGVGSFVPGARRLERPIPRR